MRKPVRLVFILFIVAAGAMQLSAQNVIREVITFVQDDGTSALQHETVRSNVPSLSLALRRNESLDDFIQILPAQHRLDMSDRTSPRIVFPSGVYSTLRKINLSRETTTRGGVTTFTTSQRYTNARPFREFSYTWVVPEEFEIVKYSSNQNGTWTTRGNAVTFDAREVNDLTFTISYRPRSQALADSVQRALSANRDVTYEASGGGAVVLIPASSLFDTGSSRVSTSGRALLARIAENVRKAPAARVTIESYLDSFAGAGTRTSDLALARAAAVASEFASNGIAGSNVEARALVSPRGGAGTPQQRKIGVVIEAAAK